MKTAQLISAPVSPVGGSRKLWKISPTQELSEWRGALRYDYIVSSAVDVMFSGPETYLFPANEQGDILDWGELDGSFRGGFDHEQAIRDAGFIIESEPS